MVLTNTFLSLSALYPIFYHPHYLQKIFGCLKNGKNQLFTLNKIECAILPQFLHKCALRKLLSDVSWLGSLLWLHISWIALMPLEWVGSKVIHPNYSKNLVDICQKIICIWKNTTNYCNLLKYCSFKGFDFIFLCAKQL